MKKKELAAAKAKAGKKKKNRGSIVIYKTAGKEVDLNVYFENESV